ncbi:MAG: hypothetical protein GY728_00875 [Phycisphaeraceae bacterium]|nr:hypothetical protein [Phycisphaeraceae bacterium]
MLLRPSKSPSATRSRPRRRSRGSARVSLPAVLAALAMVAASVLFGIYGPRMQQRGVRVAGTPLADLIKAVSRSAASYSPPRIDRFADDESDEDDTGDAGPSDAVRTAIKDMAEVLGPGVEPSSLSTRDLALVGSAIERNLAGAAGVRLVYESDRSGDRVFVFEVRDAMQFTHFDSLGRYLPLLSGTRIQEELELGPTRLGLVILGFDDRATVIIAIDVETAVEVADAIRPVLRPEESSTESTGSELS